ncbi:MAG: hypothetical protein OSJ72_19260 [Lachnospiraceae bacterium]|nr:hypothetical protein [Lachnospiraceae bacterium]
MKAKLIGYAPVGFTTPNGKLVEGMTISVGYSDEHTTGMRAKRFFVKKEIGIPQVKIGEDINIFFNQRGKVEAITKS